MDKAKIMVVEDEAIVARDIGEILVNMGYDVCATASSGRKAIQEAKDKEPDLVLMDIVLKGAMDGISTAKIINDKLEIPVIFLTAYSQDEMIARAKEVEPLGYMLKPLDERTLRPMLETSLFKAQLEKQRRKSQQYLMTTLNAIGEAVITTDPAGLVHMMNPMAEKLGGWKSKQVVTQPISEILHLEHRLSGEVVRNPVSRAMDSGRLERMAPDSVLATEDGRRLIVSGSASPIINRETGQMYGLVFIFRDITEECELREKNVLHETLLETAQQAVAFADLDGKLTYINPAFLKLMHYDNADEVLGRDAIEFWADQDQACEVIHALRQGGGWIGEMNAAHKNGTPFEVQLTAAMVKDDAGKPICMMASFIDISARRKAEEMLRHQIEIEEFVSSISTEFLALTHNEIEPGIERVLKAVGEFAAVDRSYMILFSGECRRIDHIYQWYREECGEQSELMEGLALDPLHWLMKQLEKGRLIEIPNVDDLPLDAYVEKALWNLLNHRSVLSIPLIINKKLVGMAGFSMELSQRDWRKEEVRLLKLVSEILTAALSRKFSEDAIRKSEHKLSLTYKSIGDAIMTVDEQGRVLLMNPVAEQYTGWQQDDAKGSTVTDIFKTEHQLSREALENPVVNVLRNGMVCRIENHTTLISRTGVERIVAGSAAPLVDETTGRTFGVTLIFRDITVEYAMQHALRYRVRIMKLVSSISTRFVSLTNDEILPTIRQSLKNVAEFIQADRAFFIAFRNGDQNRVDVALEWHAKELPGHIKEMREMLPSVFSWTMDKLADCEMIDLTRIGDLPEEARNESQYYNALGVKSLLMIPTVIKNDWFGAIGFCSERRERTWTQEEITLLQLTGEIVVNALTRKRIEEALMSSEKNLEVTLREIQDAMINTDAQGQVVQMNPAAEALTGWSLAEAASQSVNDIFQTVNRRTREPARNPACLVLETARVQGLANDTILIARDGTEHTIADSAAPIMDENSGQLLGVVMVFREVAEQQPDAGPEKIKPAHPYTIETSIIPIIIADLNERITQVNDAFLKLFGFARAENVLGQPFAVFLTSSGDRDIMQALRETGRFIGELSVRDKEDTPMEILLSASMVKDKKGETTCIMGSFLDITERKRTERELETHRNHLQNLVAQRTLEVSNVIDELRQDVAARRKMEEELEKQRLEMQTYMDETTKEMERINDELQREKDRHLHREAEMQKVRQEANAMVRAKSTLLSTMSHEVRTPLNGILGFAELLSETDLDEFQEDYVGIIRKNSKYLCNLINDILDLSKMEAGKLELVKNSFSPSDVVADVCRIFAAKAGAKNLTIRTEFDENIPAFVNGDEARLRQILFNLVSNAVNFTDQGDVSITGSLAETGEDMIVLEFQIRDTGIGIPADKLDKLFKAFSQVDTMEALKRGGTGLGLVICQRLCHLMNGDINVTSRDGEGACFTFTIQVEHDEHHEHNSVDLGKLDPQFADYHPLNILVVEDDEESRRLLQTMLEKMGYHPAVLPDGEAALAKCREKIFTAVLSDLQMEGMDGFDFIQQLRQGCAGEENVQAYVIAITAYADDAIRQRCRTGGMDGFLAKPMSIDALKTELIRAHMNAAVE